MVDLRIPPEDEQAALDALRDAGVRLVAVDANPPISGLEVEVELTVAGISEHDLRRLLERRGVLVLASHDLDPTWGRPPPEVMDGAMRALVDAFNEQYRHLHAALPKPVDPLPPGAVRLPAVAPWWQQRRRPPRDP